MTKNLCPFVFFFSKFFESPISFLISHLKKSKSQLLVLVKIWVFQIAHIFVSKSLKKSKQQILVLFVNSLFLRSLQSLLISDLKVVFCSSSQKSSFRIKKSSFYIKICNSSGYFQNFLKISIFENSRKFSKKFCAGIDL